MTKGKSLKNMTLFPGGFDCMEFSDISGILVTLLEGFIVIAIVGGFILSFSLPLILNMLV